MHEEWSDNIYLETRIEKGDRASIANAAIVGSAISCIGAMAIAINRAGSAHDAMVRAGRFCINLLDAGRQEHLAPFASHEGKAERFQQPDWCQNGPVWYIEGSPAAIFCTVRERVGFGTHDVLMTPNVLSHPELLRNLRGRRAALVAAGAIAAGCDVVLDCWGRMDEMVAITDRLDDISVRSRARLDAAMATIAPAEGDMAEAIATRDALIAAAGLA